MVETETPPPPRTIGGHFAACLDARANPLPGNYTYESARSALYALLKAVKAKKIYLPNYICTAVPDAIRAAGVQFETYPITSEFECALDFDLRSGDLVLLINYFGVCKPAITRALQKLPQSAVIVDCSQAFFSEGFGCLATLYSPRKFLPVPDGGFIQTTAGLLCEDPDDEASIERYKYLLERIEEEPERSRELYLKAEGALNNLSLRGMSRLTKKIVETINQNFIRRRRQENFHALSELSSINALQFDLAEQVPLSYPLMVKDGAVLREKLLKQRIFTPRYWPDVVSLNEFEHSLLNDTVHLPIDHRYGESDMKYMIDIILNQY